MTDPARGSGRAAGQAEGGRADHDGAFAATLMARSVASRLLVVAGLVAMLWAAAVWAAALP